MGTFNLRLFKPSNTFFLSLMVGLVLILNGGFLYAQGPVSLDSPLMPSSVIRTAANASLELEAVPDAGGVEAAAVQAAGSEPSAGSESPATLLDESVKIRRKVNSQAKAAVTLPWYRSGLVSLLLVLTSIGALAWLAKRFLRSTAAGGAEWLRVLGRTYLSPKQSVVLVKLGGRFAFLSVTPERISMLRIVDDNQEAALLQSQATSEHKGKNGVDFDNLLAGEVDRLGDHLEPQLASASESLDALTSTRREVKGLLSRLQGYRKVQKSHTGSSPQRHATRGGKTTTVGRS